MDASPLTQHVGMPETCTPRWVIISSRSLSSSLLRLRLYQLKKVNYRLTLSSTVGWHIIPQGTAGVDFTLTELKIRSGAWIDYMRACYKLKDGSSQCFENGGSGGYNEQIYGNLDSNPIVSMTYGSEE